MRARMITAVLATIVGVVWTGQGLGLFRGSSFMVGDARWAAAGLGAVAVGAILGVSAWRARNREA